MRDRCPLCDLPGADHRPACSQDNKGAWWDLHVGRHPNFPPEMAAAPPRPMRQAVVKVARA